MKHIVMIQPLCKEGYEIMEKADCIILRMAHLNRKEVEGAPRLSVIGRTGVGYDSVAVAAAPERGIPIVITPGANGDAEISAKQSPDWLRHCV